MEEKEFKKILLMVLAIALLIATAFIIRPIFVSIIFGLILGYIFYPLYKKVYKITKSENISAIIIVVGILLIILLPIAFLIPVVTRQIVEVYRVIQTLDVVSVLKNVFPNAFDSVSPYADIAAITHSITSNAVRAIMSVFEQLIFNLPGILLNFIIVLFTFFFVIKDYPSLKEYLIAISPLSEESRNRFYKKFEQITNSILYGQVITGIIQGLVAGIGYFIFGVSNALLLTLLTMVTAMIPIIGAWVVWVPIDIYLFASNQTNAGIGLLIYGILIISWIDNLIRPLIISRISKMNSAIALIGMVGGLFVFGFIGIVLGPLILAYFLLLAEMYKETKFKSILFEEEPHQEKKPGISPQPGS